MSFDDMTRFVLGVVLVALLYSGILASIRYMIRSGQAGVSGCAPHDDGLLE